MLTHKEAILLLELVFNRAIKVQDFEDQKTMDSLISKQYAKIGEERGEKFYIPTSLGVTNSKIFKSGINYDTLLTRSSFVAITKLLSKVLDKCKESGIHLNVWVKNTDDDTIDWFIDEVNRGIELRNEKATKGETVSNS